MKHLLTADNWSRYTRIASKHVDEEEVDTFIEECEQLFIIPAVGSDMFLRLVGEDLDENLSLLLEGGEYVDKAQKKHVFKGIRYALAYFVYAKMAKNDGSMLSRAGFLQPQDEYAARMDDKNRINRYNDLMNVAESYLSGSLEYLKTWDDVKVKPVRGSRVRIIDIGD